MNLDGEAIEFEWKIRPGFTTLTVLKEIQMDLERKNIEPENLEDRIIFMSMFNDIEWEKNDVNCISNAEKVKNYTKRFLPGHWTFLGPGSEKRWYGDSHDGQQDRTANKMVQQGHPIFPATSALSRGILKRRNGKSTIHFNGDFMNTELLFQTINSVNQVSIHAIVTNWCYNFALKKEEKEHVPTPVNNRIMAVVESEQVDMLISFPNLAQGNLMMQSDAKFRVLEKNVHMTQLCAKALFQYLVTAGSRHQVRPDGEDGWGQIAPLCREYTCSRVFTQAKPLGAIPSGTIIRPIQEVHVVKLLDEHEVEVAIPSVCKTDVTYVVISTETERFVNDIHTREAKTRSSRELLKNPQESKESMSYKQREVTTPSGNLGSSQHWGNSCRLCQSCSK